MERFQAFELAHAGGGGAEGEESSHAYIWTCTSIIGGIYLFFLIERFMRMINVWREVGLLCLTRPHSVNMWYWCLH